MTDIQKDIIETIKRSATFFVAQAESGEGIMITKESLLELIEQLKQENQKLADSYNEKVYDLESQLQQKEADMEEWMSEQQSETKCMFEAIEKDVKQKDAEIKRHKGAVDDMFQNREKWRESHMILEVQLQQQAEVIRNKDSEIERLKWEAAWVGAHQEDARRSAETWKGHYSSVLVENKRLRAALEWYADTENHRWKEKEDDPFFPPWTNVLEDEGEIARDVLSSIQGESQ